MEENHRSETTELRGPKSDASSLTADRDRCSMCFPANLNDNTKWTDEKHRAYLNHLEYSFVKELRHSINSLPRGKGHNHKNGSICEMELIDAHYTSKQVCIMENGKWTTSEEVMLFSFTYPSIDSHGTAKNQEGSGQNFVDEESHNTTNTISRLRRMR